MDTGHFSGTMAAQVVSLDQRWRSMRPHLPWARDMAVGTDVSIEFPPLTPSMWAPDVAMDDSDSSADEMDAAPSSPIPSVPVDAEVASPASGSLLDRIRNVVRSRSPKPPALDVTPLPRVPARSPRRLFSGASDRFFTPT
jgi:hypothetical protein